MKKLYCFFLFVTIAIASYGQKKPNVMNNGNASVTCKLTTPELQERKRTVLAEVKQLVVQRTETEKGIKYKTERLCCDFFTFSLTVGEEENFVWLELSGPEGTKEFIETEIGF
jgi:hypothetical protein